MSVGFWLQVFAANDHTPIGDAELSGGEYWVPDPDVVNNGAYWVQADYVGEPIAVSAPNYQTVNTTIAGVANQLVYLTWIGAWPQAQTY